MTLQPLLGTSPITGNGCCSRVIVRLGTENRMVTNGYQKGVYDRVTRGTWEGQIQPG
jgi:hypothetical protein